MKKIVATLLIVFTVTLCKAQWVTIPDANFRNWLNTHGFSSCMNGTLMDTTCSAVVNATDIVCDNANITNLTGIQYFNSLTYLYCFGNYLPSLPTLPSFLTYLNCGGNQLTGLPFLPNTLVQLNCYGNQLITLPVLPNSLTQLYCGNNDLTSLPQLPNSLSDLSCYGNHLTILPVLPTSLLQLTCYNNELISLPNLPSTLYMFQIYNNPGLICMPTLNNFIGLDIFFDISNTGITCLSNLIQHTGYIAAIDTMPICICNYPTGVSTTNITSNSAKVNWSAECCSEYRIQYRVTGTTTWTTKIATPSAIFKNLTLLSLGTTYDLRMRVVCTGGTSFSSWSPIQNFTTTGSCSAPSGISVNNVLQTQANFSWNTVAGAYSYQLVIRKQGTTAWFPFTIIAPSTSQLVQWLTHNTIYEYRMKTICSASGTPSSSLTGIQTFTTPFRLEDANEDEASEILVYPNPVTNQLTVNCNLFASEVIEIKDLLGRTCFSEKLKLLSENMGAINYTIDVSNLPSALYFISIRRNDGSALIKQFVKE